MKKGGLIVVFALMFYSCIGDDSSNQQIETTESFTVVANRGSANVSFINQQDNTVENVSIPGSEPMYVVYNAENDRIYVGDRAQSKIHVIDADSKMVVADIDVGNGVFHMWADGSGRRLWVSCDIDNVISVVDLRDNTLEETIALTEQPHDIFVSSSGNRAYVSTISADPMVQDSVFVYNNMFEKTNAVGAGKDPHLFLINQTNQLFVPSQSGQVRLFNATTLALNEAAQYEGAHGIFVNPRSGNVYVTNISGDQIYALNRISLEEIERVNTTSATPHNLVVENSGSVLYATHSGATANTVTTYDVRSNRLEALGTITVGTNPFGITQYTRLIN